MGRTAGSSSSTPTVAAGAESIDMLIGLQYTRFLREDLAATFGAHALAAGASSKVTPAGAFSGSKAVVALLLGLRWNPMRGDLRTQAIRPYLAAGFGPVIGASSGSKLAALGFRDAQGKQRGDQ
jgi:hypothetical protein